MQRANSSRESFCSAGTEPRSAGDTLQNSQNCRLGVRSDSICKRGSVPRKALSMVLVWRSGECRDSGTGCELIPVLGTPNPAGGTTHLVEQPLLSGLAERPAGKGQGVCKAQVCVTVGPAGSTEGRQQRGVPGWLLCVPFPD